jgi:cell division inhibitor SepF
MEEAEDHETVSADARKSNKGNIVSIHSQRNVRVVLNEPRSYEETQEIADHLRSRRPVVVNLQRVRTEQAIRIVDFLSGTVYALNGGITKIGPNIFLCTPDSVEIQGAISEMMHDQDEFNR